MFPVLLVLPVVISYACARNHAPNIIFIMADDMGWNDVSFHGSPQIPTPNIDALAASGIVLQNYYTAPQCTPSRASLMTGKYSIRLGLQNFVINAGAPYGLPLTSKILPQYLKKLGYSTHGVGKWHLGFHRKEYTPTHRGFNSFFGYWNGLIDYYDHTNYETVSGVDGFQAIWGVDLHNGTEAVKNFRGQYATDLFTEEAVKVIEQHNANKPLFLYVSHLACHTGNDYLRMQAPPSTVAKFHYIKDISRRTYAGVVHKLDESVGKIFSSLSRRGMLENSIVIFSSDNGGEPEGARGGHASNWPLRSMKFHLWEGGVKVPSLIWSPLFQLKRPRVITQLMHIIDWLPTLYSAAGGQLADLGDIDGIDMWRYLVENQSLPRKEVLLNINPVDGTAGLVRRNFKLVSGDYPDGKSSWYGPSGREEVKVTSMDEWVWKEHTEVKSVLQSHHMWLLKEPDSWRSDLVVDCGHCHDFVKLKCQPHIEPCLYNLEVDPCEFQNVASQYPKIVRAMMTRLEEYNKTSVPPNLSPVDPRADPRCHGFAYVPWLDKEHKSDCPYL